MVKQKQGAVTISDVAELAGASRTTVSYALTQPGRVSTDMLKRVQSAIDELGFVRNDNAHRLRAGRSQAIAMIVPNGTHPVFTEIASGAEVEAAKQGRFILVANSNDEISRERDYIQFFRAQKVRAILISPVDAVPESLSSPTADPIPFVVIGPTHTSHGYPSVSGNDEHGGYLACKHLLDQGRRKILFVGGPHENVKARFNGARRAAVRYPDSTIRFALVEQQSFVAGERIAEEILDSGPLATDGVMAGNDLLALGILNVLTRSGIDVPRDVSLIGYDDIEYSKFAIKPLTSIRHPLHAFGREAVRLALSDELGSVESRNLSFEPELVVRATSLPTD